MCGRAYQTYTEDELYVRYIHESSKRRPLGLRPNYNLAPTQLSPIVLIEKDVLTIRPLRWGLVPFWAKDVKSAAKYSLINAKGEEIAEKRSYKAAFERRRCIVPVTGFYEWKREGEGPKRPFAIHSAQEPILSLAGVWEHWEGRDGAASVDSFSIITTEANATMSRVHDRMPVILSPKNEAEWLDPSNHDLRSLQKLLKPASEKLLEMHEISPLVNAPRNNRPEVLTPVEEAPSASPPKKASSPGKRKGKPSRKG